MKKRNERTLTPNTRYIREKELPIYTGLGLSKAKELAKLAGAKRKIGSAVIYDTRILDEYIASLSN